jgi:molybdenum cofactor cytidylyltransferase
VILVLGHEAEKVRAELGGRDLRFACNPHHEKGLSSSLKAGLDALPADIEGCVILLGDMPLVGSAHIDRLIDAFDPSQGRAIIVPVRAGQRGNPTLWAKRFFPAMKDLAGDTGARQLITRHAALVFEVEMQDDAVLLDVDTPASLAAIRKAKPA